MLNYLGWLLVSMVVIFLDRWSKFYAQTHLKLHHALKVNRYFNWYLDYNHGAAWSFLSAQSGWQRWVLAGFSAVVSMIILFWLRKSKEYSASTNMGLSFILGGAVGNLIDRIYPGVVTDFIQWHYKAYYWPTFNIADSAVCVGAVLFIWGMRNES